MTTDNETTNQQVTDAEEAADTISDVADDTPEDSLGSDNVTDSEAETLASEAAPTEIFYPTAPVVDVEATVATEPASQATSTAVNGVGDYLPVGTVKTTATTAASTPDSDASPVSESSTSEAPADETVSAEENSTETVTTDSEASQPEGTASHTAIVRSTAHLVVSSAAGVPASVASNSAHPAVIPDAAVATTPDQATIKPVVQPTTTVAPTDTQAPTVSVAPTSQVTDATDRPAEVNQLLAQRQTILHQPVRHHGKLNPRPSRHAVSATHLAISCKKRATTNAIWPYLIGRRRRTRQRTPKKLTKLNAVIISPG